MAEMYVVIYLNSDGWDVPHWCLWTRDDDGNELIFEALGSTGTRFTYHSRPVDMLKSESRKTTPHIGRIEADVWDEVPELLEGVPMNNDDPAWNCQNWIMEAIQALQREGYLEEDEEGLSYIRHWYQQRTDAYP
ncbi:hypothetical protein FQN54_005017 [Arachnomyces sp. PD_36]|nr:hypothetical protein FQN54_005017 [Arachnomyces sp. PD_36]